MIDGPSSALELGRSHERLDTIPIEVGTSCAFLLFILTRVGPNETATGVGTP